MNPPPWTSWNLCTCCDTCLLFSALTHICTWITVWRSIGQGRRYTHLRCSFAFSGYILLGIPCIFPCIGQGSRYMHVSCSIIDFWQICNVEMQMCTFLKQMWHFQSVIRIPPSCHWLPRIAKNVKVVATSLSSLGWYPLDWESATWNILSTSSGASVQYDS